MENTNNNIKPENEGSKEKIKKTKFQRHNPNARNKVHGCVFCLKKVQFAPYYDESFYRPYLTKSGRIISRRITGICVKHQHHLTREIKRARIMALLPFVVH